MKVYDIQTSQRFYRPDNFIIVRKSQRDETYEIANLSLNLFWSRSAP